MTKGCQKMSTVGTDDDLSNAEIVDAELHPESRLRYIQHRMQEEEGTRLSIDSVAYVLRCSADYDKVHGLG